MAIQGGDLNISSGNVSVAGDVSSEVRGGATVQGGLRVTARRIPPPPQIALLNPFCTILAAVLPLLFAVLVCVCVCVAYYTRFSRIGERKRV